MKKKTKKHAPKAAKKARPTKSIRGIRKLELPRARAAPTAPNAAATARVDALAARRIEALRFEGAQALIPGETPRAQLVSPHPDDAQRTVMTLRTDRGQVRVWKVAARIEGETFPMNWALKVLNAAAAKLIRESGGVVRT